MARALARSRPIGFSTISRENGWASGGATNRARASCWTVGTNIDGGTAR